MSRRLGYLWLLVAGLLITSSAGLPMSSASAAPEYSIVDLGTLPGATPDYVFATAINEHGQVVGSSTTTHALMWGNGRYGIEPNHIVLGGASGRLAPGAASPPTPRYQPLFTPDDVRDADLSVRGVVA
jgi:probable HAF family extracellular repeat protein